MGGNSPTPFSESFKPAKTNNLRYNTSQKGSPLPIVYGTKRLGPNLIGGFGFTKTGGSKKGGGKGGTSKATKKGGGPQYSVNAAFALCQGPVSFTDAPHAISGSNRVWSNGTAVGANTLPLNYYTGEDGQAPDPVFETSSGDPPILGYSGTAYITGTPIELGSSPVLPNVQAEITGFGAGTGGAGFPGDARPDWIVIDLLCNDRYGAGFPLAHLDCGGGYGAGGSVGDWGDYCQASSLAMSLLLDRQQAAAHWLEGIVEQTSSAIFWAATTLKIVPHAGAAVTGNGMTWTPSLSSQASLTDADFLDFGGGSDPAVVTRTDPASRSNWITVEFENADNDYNTETTQVFDQAAIDAYGLVQEPNFLASGMQSATSAASAAQIRLDRVRRIANGYKFKLGFRHSLVEQMDIVTITDATAGIDAKNVRITQIDEDDNGELTITAEDLDPLASVIPARSAATVAPLVDSGVDPGAANQPIIFEPPPALTSSRREVWVVSSGGPDWGGAHVWVSLDDTSYSRVGTIYAGARQGVLTADLPSGSDPDTTNTLLVDLTESRGELLSTTTAIADALVTLCYVDGELIAYRDAGLTSAYHYDLDYLRRGAYGSTIGAHLTGDKFARLVPTDGTVWTYEYPDNFIGQTIYIKLQSFNIFFGQAQDVAGLTADSYTLTGAGAVSSNVVPIQFLGNPQSGSPIVRFTFASATSFAAGLPGSTCTAGAAPTGARTFNIAKNGSNVGTMSFAAGATIATFAMASAQSFAAGDILTITPTSTDATLANLSGYLAGTAG